MVICNDIHIVLEQWQSLLDLCIGLIEFHTALTTGQNFLNTCFSVYWNVTLFNV